MQIGVWTKISSSKFQYTITRGSKPDYVGLGLGFEVVFRSIHHVHNNMKIIDVTKL